MRADNWVSSLKNFINTFQTKKAIFIIAIVGFIVYFNSLFNGFVWDDGPQIIENTLLHSISNFFRFFSGSTFYEENVSTLQGTFYRPFFLTFLSLLYSIFGAHAFFFHLFQIFLHLAIVTLIFLILQKFINIYLSLLLSLIFIVHPINVESVSYISAVGELLFVFFGTLALYLVILDRWKAKVKFYVFALLAASIFSKETGMLFLPLIPIYIFLYRKKDFWLYTLISFGVLIVYSLLRVSTIGPYVGGAGVWPIMNITFNERLINIPAIMFYYFKILFFPLNLAISQVWVIKTADIHSFYLPVLFLGLLTLVIFAAGFHLRKDHKDSFKAFLLFLSWFILGFIFHLQLIPLDFTVADRWFYFPFIGLLGLVGVSLRNIKTKKVYMYLCLGTSFLIILFLSLRTVIRNFNWSNNEILFVHDEKINTESFELENSLGYQFILNEDLDRAEFNLKRSIELVPNWWYSWDNLGVVYARKGEHELAEKSFQKAIDINRFPTAYHNMATLLFLVEKDYKRASEFLDKALEMFPRNIMFWRMKAISDYNLGNQDGAQEAASELLRLDPSNENYAIYSQIIQRKYIDLKL